MSMQVRYTKGFLLDFKRRLDFIRDAHQLLEMKRDQLIRELRSSIDELKVVRGKVEKELEELESEVAFFHVAHGSQELLTAPTLEERLEVEVLPRSVIGVSVPLITEIKIPEVKEKYPPHIAALAEKVASVARDLIKLAEIEAAIERLADDLQKTNIRVNALEKAVIPQYESIIKKIQDALDHEMLEEFMRVKQVKSVLVRRRGQT